MNTSLTCPRADLIREIRRRAADLRPALEAIGRLARDSVLTNFERGGRPAPWPPALRVLEKGGLTLVRTGRLRDSIRDAVPEVSADRVSLTTPVEYAAAHQRGSAGRLRGGLKSREPRPPRPPGGASPAGAARRPAAPIPARPFLVWQRPDIERAGSGLLGWVARGESA